MEKNMKNLKVLFSVVILHTCFFSNVALAEVMDSSSALENPSKGLKSMVEPGILDIKEDDIIMGVENAPITIIEYSSMSCPHCGHYHNDVFPHIKSKYILNEKVKYILRDFPLNSSALMAAKIAHCTGNDRYYDFVSTLFEWQTQWAFTREYKYPLEKIAKLGGISEEKLLECTTDKKLEDFLLGRAMKANNKLEIDETPTFFINGERHTGAKPFSYYEKIIDKKLEELK